MRLPRLSGKPLGREIVNLPKSSLVRLALCVFTVAPFVLLAAMFLLLFAAPNYDFSWLAKVFLWSMAPFFATWLYYLVIVATSSLETGQKAVWIAALCATAPLAAPIFWFIYLRQPQRSL